MKMSVAMCTYNGARFLSAQLESLAAQTRIPDELVVCDDGSTDATREIVAAFAASAVFPVHFHQNEINLGSTRNFEKAARLCSGDFILFADQDDVWLPQKLKRIESEFLQNPRVGLVFTDAELVDENLKPLGARLWQTLGFDNTLRRRVTGGRALDVLLPGWTVTGATMAFRSRFKNLALGIPEDLAMIHDGWIALVIASVSDVALIDEPLIEYRQHGGQQIGAPEKKTESDRKIKTLDDVRATLNRANSFAELIEIASRLRQRLRERQDQFHSEDALAQLDARLAHMRARERLANKRLKRLRPVLGELLMLRYHRYSNGIYSAAKDLLG